VLPRRIARFLEPCLLLLLRGDASHGYNLVDALSQFGFAPGTIDASVVYRMLREMEVGGWVTSQWDTAGSGPPRRVYQVTPEGEAYLAAWVDDLRHTREELDRFIAFYVHQGTASESKQT
jgi:poly-beta-hydroxybutyrate-responsive repressor